MKLKPRLKLSYLILTLAVGLNAETNPPTKTEQQKPVAAPPVKDNIWIASKQNPKLKVELLAPSRSRQTSLVSIIGEHVAFSNTSETKNEDGCLGQDINAFSLIDASEFVVASIPCVIRLEPSTNENSLLVYSRDPQTKRSQIFKIEKVEVNTNTENFLPELINGKSSSLQSVRFAFFIDQKRSEAIKKQQKTFNFKRDTPQISFPFLNDDKIHLITRLASNSNAGYFYDSYSVPSLTPKNPLPSTLTISQLDERKPTDFVVSKAGLAYVLLDGGNRKLGRIVWFDSNFSQKIVSGFVGGTKPLTTNDWQTMPKEDLSFRKPRFIEPVENGFVAAETSNDFTWDYRFVFYYSHDQKEAFNLTFLTYLPQNVTGLKWFKKGLLVALDDGSIAWYGDENPFANKNFKVTNLEIKEKETP